jgi:hypothetical protein
MQTTDALSETLLNRHATKLWIVLCSTTTMAKAAESRTELDAALAQKIT